MKDKLTKLKDSYPFYGLPLLIAHSPCLHFIFYNLDYVRPIYRFRRILIYSLNWIRGESSILYSYIYQQKK